MRKLRNGLTKRVCDFMLNRVATPDYKMKIDMLIKQGMFHAEFGGPYIMLTDEEKQRREQMRD